MTTRYRTTETTTWREVDGEIVALELKDSVYFSIGGAGSLLWKRLVDGVTRDQMVEELTRSFEEVDAATAAADVDGFIVKCLEHKLIETLD